MFAVMCRLCNHSDGFNRISKSQKDEKPQCCIFKDFLDPSLGSAISELRMKSIIINKEAINELKSSDVL